jgi:hypothetical protein
MAMLAMFLFLPRLEFKINCSELVRTITSNTVLASQRLVLASIEEICQIASVNMERVTPK